LSFYYVQAALFFLLSKIATFQRERMSSRDKATAASTRDAVST